MGYAKNYLIGREDAELNPFGPEDLEDPEGGEAKEQLGNEPEDERDMEPRGGENVELRPLLPLLYFLKGLKIVNKAIFGNEHGNEQGF